LKNTICFVAKKTGFLFNILFFWEAHSITTYLPKAQAEIGNISLIFGGPEKPLQDQ